MDLGPIIVSIKFLIEGLGLKKRQLGIYVVFHKSTNNVDIREGNKDLVEE